MTKQIVPHILPNNKYSFPFEGSLKEKPIQIKGIAAWGLTGKEEWWAILHKIEETPLDTIISTRQIVLRISMYPDQFFEITAPLKENVVEAESLDRFVTGLKSFVIKEGYQFKALPISKVPLALLAPMAEDEVTESFECFITEIDDDVAFVTLVDDIGEKSYMEIPLEDLKKNKIEHKPGTIFSFLFKRRGEWEAVELSPIKRSPMTRSELENLLNYYKEKYGDV